MPCIYTTATSLVYHLWANDINRQRLANANCMFTIYKYKVRTEWSCFFFSKRVDRRVKPGVDCGSLYQQTIYLFGKLSVFGCFLVVRERIFNTCMIIKCVIIIILLIRIDFSEIHFSRLKIKLIIICSFCVPGLYFWVIKMFKKYYFFIKIKHDLF